MPLNLASPGIVVREVDLTVGRVSPAANKIGALVAPFAKGPVDVPTYVENENGLLQTFGEPYTADKHYEYWLSASSYLSYGGALQIVRCDDSSLRNSVAGITSVGIASTSVTKIKSLEHYNQLGYDENTIAGVTFIAKNPGSWANGIRVAFIDARVDQTLGINTTAAITVGMGVTQSISAILPGAGSTTILDGYLEGIITDVGTSSIGVKVLKQVSSGATAVTVDYQPSGVYAFRSGSNITVTNSSGVGVSTTNVASAADWFDAQTVGLTTSSSINWNNITDRPSTTSYAAARNSRFDEIHILVIDSEGYVTGNAGTILEKHLGLSKGTDATFSVGSPAYWRKYLAANSAYVFGGSAPAGITTTAFSSGSAATSQIGAGVGFTLASDNGWDQPIDGTNFAAYGSTTLTLVGGKNYDGNADLTLSGALSASIADISTGYDLFENPDNFKVDFLLMGSANYAKENAQSLANKLISVAELRKDSLAFISPYRGAALTDTTSQTAVNVNSSSAITDNIVSFYAPVASSSYAVFDSGYKYMYDRFSDTFRYVPLNGDIAGLCARTDINNFPWFSPAGTSRGSILNAVKLAYNPSKSQRDKLYSNRVNSVVFSPGAGIILFGDKTGLAKASAFDRINVRRLFVYLETAISSAAKDSLFEFNDEITRTNFVNTVEPFLRDVQANRGIFDFVVVCDETNNTPAVIDNNEFIADIYIKPTRSINFIGLTFIATKTGVDFEEVIGNF
jgi:hypothetical protein